MSILRDMNELVRACYPQSQQEALELWHDIKPVKFGTSRAWTIAQIYGLAFFSIPDDAAYLVVTRVSCYVGTNVATAAGYGLHGPPPPEFSFVHRWVADQDPQVFPPPVTSNVTGEGQLHILADYDVDELLFFKAGLTVNLLADLPANPTADARFIRTLVYSYLLGPKVADKLGSGEALIQT